MSHHEGVLQHGRLGESLPERVIVVRALPGLGDLLCAVPALRALRAALPEAHITLLGLPAARGFVTRFSHYLDELLELPGYPGLPECPVDRERWPAFLAEVHARRFDLALQMHGSGIVTNPLTLLLGARYSAGCYLPGQYCPDPQRFLPYPAHEPEIWRHLRLLESLGVPLHGDALEFPLTADDWHSLAELEEARDLTPGAYLCLHPGASLPARRWPVERFAALADALARQGWQVVLTGVASETELTAAVARAMTTRPIDLAGRTSLGALAALLSRARLLVSNDTGVSHLAAALRVPSVVIFTASDPARWAPLDRQHHRIICPPGLDDGQQAACAVASRCLREGCIALERPLEPAPASRVSLETVLAAVDDQLRSSTLPSYGPWAGQAASADLPHA